MPDQSPTEIGYQPLKTDNLNGQVSEMSDPPAARQGLIARLRTGGFRGAVNPPTEQETEEPALADEPRSSMTYYARNEQTGEELREKTAQKEEEREKQFQEERERLPLFDFSNHRELRNALGWAQYRTKLFFIQKLQKYGMPQGAIDAMRGFRPRYTTLSQQSNEEGSFDGGGTFQNNGLVFVGVWPDNPLRTALTAAHEGSHFARGNVEQFDEVSGELKTSIRGLMRRYFEGDQVREEGDFLENAMSVWDEADMYGTLTQPGTPFLKGKTLSRLTTSVSTILYEPHRKAVDLARSIGMPTDLLNPQLATGNTDAVNQMIAIWRIARLIGMNTTENWQNLSATELAEKGREILERSRYHGTREAHEQIEQIFGSRAENILDRSHWPEDVEFSTLINPALTLTERAFKEKVKVPPPQP